MRGLKLQHKHILFTQCIQMCVYVDVKSSICIYVPYMYLGRKIVYNQKPNKISDDFSSKAYIYSLGVSVCFGKFRAFCVSPQNLCN